MDGIIVYNSFIRKRVRYGIFAVFCLTKILRFIILSVSFYQDLLVLLICVFLLS